MDGRKPSDDAEEEVFVNDDGDLVDSEGQYLDSEVGAGWDEDDDSTYVNEDGILVDEDGEPVGGFTDGYDIDPEPEDSEDDEDDVDSPPMTQRESLALIMEVAPVGAEIELCRYVNPDYCQDRAARLRPGVDIEDCSSCALIVWDGSMTLDELVRLATLN